MKKPSITINGYKTREELEKEQSYLSKSLEIIRKNGFKWWLSLAWWHIKKDFMTKTYWPLITRLHKNRLFLKEVLGSKMYLDPTDYGLSRDLACGGIREPACTRILLRELKKGMIVVDIGANIGYYALMEARTVGEKGKVYALEPHPKNFEILRKNIEINGYQNIKAYQIAIGDRKGRAKLGVSDYSNLHKIIEEKESDFTQYIEVEITTLDEFLKDKESPNFIRMDIEGYETKALQGMKKTLKETEPPLKLFIEIHPFLTDTKWLQRELLDLGFKPICYISYFACVYKMSTEDLLNLNLAPGYLFLEKNE